MCGAELVVKFYASVMNSWCWCGGGGDGGGGSVVVVLWCCGVVLFLIT